MLRWLIAAFLAFTLGACATTASAPPAPAPLLTTLDLCAGLRVVNAPATDRRGRVIDLEPLMTVRGLALRRLPSGGCLGSGFGLRKGGAGAVHEGVDLVTPRPVPIGAAAEGTISRIGTLRGYGLTVDIRHGREVVTRYAHLSATPLRLAVGASVAAGEIIGFTGDSGNATGVHLHYEIIVDGAPVDPLAPASPDRVGV